MALRGFSCDDETGEIVSYDVNEETGEPFMDTNIPPIYVGFKKTKNNAEPVKYMQFPKGYMSKTKKFQSLKEQILAGSNKISYRLLLIPTLAFFPAYICTFLIILEVYLHARCHINNEKTNDPNTYYRSPFHMITSTFCGECREWDTASKIGQLQDKRRSRHDYIKSLAI